MKRKIYNKKNFWGGIVFLVLAAVSIPSTITDFNNLGALRIIKSIILDTFCLLLGVTQVCRSLSSKSTKEDYQNDDERVNLVNMKSEASAFNITLYICVTILLLSMVAWGKTKSDVFLAICGSFCIIYTIMKIVHISSYFYHNKRN